MKKPRFTEEQIVFVLKQAELGTSVPDVCRKHHLLLSHCSLNHLAEKCLDYPWRFSLAANTANNISQYGE